ncbi:hypothetical protein DXT99_01285 [Pontibacter diazotrophicus]|uniref:Uncharacterized protein n=1 Tax=Pontibacter diazotrophicus TaxID=1400979 RepID=A0A3D8LIA3_9BACT|nr:hypothetical protein DXT99_01285 [Pontibacter diazotrophicus]
MSVNAHFLLEKFNQFKNTKYQIQPSATFSMLNHALQVLFMTMKLLLVLALEFCRLHNKTNSNVRFPGY